MKLIRCHIENFGKLQNQDISFSDGCNICCRENGWGKSTLAAFLKVMLYGFDNERSRDDFASERRRYRPWQGGVYGGSLTFETGNQIYTVTRTFGLKEKEDTFVLRDEITNLESRDFSSNLGEELLGVDAGSFGKTIFLSQNDCETTVTDRIHAKLGNLTDAVDDMSHYEQADARLNDKLNAMSPLRRTGSLYRMKEQIASLEAEIGKGRALESEMESVLAEKNRTQEEYRQWKEQQQELSKSQQQMSILKDLQAKKLRYDALLKESARRKEEADRCRSFFPSNLPQREELDERIGQCISMAAQKNALDIYCLTDQEERRLEKWSGLFAVGESGEAEQQTTDADDLDWNSKKQENLFRLLTLCGIAAALLGVLLLWKNNWGGVFLLAAGGTGFAIGLIQIQKLKIAREYENLILENPQEEKNESYLEYTRLREKKSCYEEAKQNYDELKNGIEEFVRELGFAPEPDQGLQRQLLTLKSHLEAYENARQESVRADRELIGFEKSENMNQIITFRNPSFSEQTNSLESGEQKRRQIQEKLEECHRKLLQAERRMQELMQRREEISQKEEELVSLREQYHTDCVKYEHLKMTREYLAKAKAAYTAKYRNPLMESFSTYYGMLSGATADGYRMDANIQLTKEELGHQRETRYFSAGWKDLTGICLRMALVDVMYRQEKPFLIFDDPFVNLDQKKVEAGKEFLKKLSNDYQIIYFTCHESRR